ncbi:MAG: GNAT family N-acetyltransferase [Alphaproteobacteria bacterium]|nr:GNAT family N-acetyltransferase [Alphaproteobacteria bacterium]
MPIDAQEPDVSAIDLPLPVLTPRLTLRPIRPGDGAVILDYKTESWQEFSRWMIWTHAPAVGERTVEDEEAFCRSRNDLFIRRESLGFLAFDRAEGGLIGAGGLHQCDWRVPMFSLGFSVRTGKAGRGYATEIATALGHYAFGALSARKLSAFHAAGNAGSRRVLEKAGFEREGVLRRQHLLPEGLVDEIHYGLLDPSRLPSLDVTWGKKT